MKGFSSPIKTSSSSGTGLASYNSVEVNKTMIKRYRCSHCGTVFSKYLAPFEELKIVECIECNEAAHLILASGTEPASFGSAESGWFFLDPVRIPVR
jgi:DNA-directed RNA polymerase subunit RPC12/RpoP